jgi:serine/threonine protein kinase
MADRVGQQLGQYSLKQLLGRGGFAEVYLGEHIQSKTPAAIKILSTQVIAGDKRAFYQEVRIMVNLVHPHIVRVFGFDELSDPPFLVMDYAPNGTLRRRYPRGSVLSLETVLPLFKQAADALQYAHEQKLIHLDVKPENMLLGPRNELLLSDFGIARALQTQMTHLSVQGFGGTAIYAAPEQFQGKPGPASDQYALATIVYEWLTGALPFAALDWMALGFKKTSEPPPPLRDKAPAISREVEQVVLTALATDPRDRFASVCAFAEAFENACQSPNQRATFGNLPTFQKSDGFAGAHQPGGITTPLQQPSGGVGWPANPLQPPPAPSPTLWSPPTGPITPPPIAPVNQSHPPQPAGKLAPAPADSNQFHWGRAALGGSFGLLFGAFFFLAMLLALTTMTVPTDDLGFILSSNPALGSFDSILFLPFSSAPFDLIAACYSLAGMLIVGCISGYAQSGFNWRRAARRCLRAILGLELVIALLLLVDVVIISSTLASWLLRSLFITLPCGLLLGTIRGTRSGRSSFSWAGFALGLGAIIMNGILVGGLSVAGRWIVGGGGGDFLPLGVCLPILVIGVIWGNVEGHSWQEERFGRWRFYLGMIGIWAIIFLLALLETLRLGIPDYNLFNTDSLIYGVFYSMVLNTYAYATIPAGLAFGVLAGYSRYWLDDLPPRLVWVRPLVWALVGVVIGAMLGFVLEPSSSYHLLANGNFCRVVLYPGEVLRQRLQNAGACSPYLSPLLGPSLAALLTCALAGGVAGLLIPFLPRPLKRGAAVLKRGAAWLYKIYKLEW